MSKKRVNSGISPKLYFLLMFVAAIVIVFAVLMIAYLSGLRYVKYNTEEHGIIRYLGKVDSEGFPDKGKVYFKDGASAEIKKADGVLSFADGSTLKGTLFEMDYADGVVYVGQIDHFMQHGKGRLQYKGGDIYEGDFNYDEISGEGKYYYVSGDVYSGSFENGKKNGAGVYEWAPDENGKRDMFSGNYINDRRYGYGVYTSADGTTYEGDYVNDIKQGSGKLTFADGDVYEGSFDSDTRTGKGTYTWASGESYTGEFLKNTITGYGTYYWTSGNNRMSYEGYFLNGKVVHPDADEDETEETSGDDQPEAPQTDD